MTRPQTSPPAVAASEPLIAVRGVSKRFAGVQALDDVTLSIGHGVVHALVGENGAGKSTLGKVIAGVIRPDAGELRVAGEPRGYRSPHAALSDGIAAIQQEIALVPQARVIDNIFLGHESVSAGVVREREMRRRFEALREQVPFDVDPDAIAGTLRIADQQKVEVMRAIARRARVIVMDEPTAALTDDESASLIAAVRWLRERGTTIVYVSHFLEEVLALADAVTVLRNGTHVVTRPAAELTHDSLVEAMLGRSLVSVFPVRSEPEDHVAFEARGVTRHGAVEDASLRVRRGEIVGIAGLVGSGRTELARLLCGVDRRDAGEILVDGEPVAADSPRSALSAGIAMLPESRKAQGLVMSGSVGHNITLPRLGRLTRAGFVRGREERRQVGGLLERFDVRPATPQSRVAELSGGNQQKALFAKWLMRPPRVFIVDEPTRGVDIGAKAAIYDLIVDLAASGMAVVVISSELEEVLGLSHRVLVMRRGRLTAEFAAAEATEENVMHAAFGTGGGSSRSTEPTGDESD